MDTKNRKLVLIRGGGDLASGVGGILHRNGWQLVICELPEPIVVRRKVAFAETVWEGLYQVEEIQSVLVETDQEVEPALLADKIAVVVDPEMKIADRFDFKAIVDARMLKTFQTPVTTGGVPVIGLGPGFIAGENCLVVVETKRGASLGKIIWDGAAQPNTGTPGIVEGRGLERVLYTPCDGVVRPCVEIGDLVSQGQVLAVVGESAVVAPFDGLVRGMLRPGIRVRAHTKLGDVDPRREPGLESKISDKALIIGRSVLKVIESLS